MLPDVDIVIFLCFCSILQRHGLELLGLKEFKNSPLLCPQVWVLIESDLLWGLPAQAKGPSYTREGMKRQNLHIINSLCVLPQELP